MKFIKITSKTPKYGTYGYKIIVDDIQVGKLYYNITNDTFIISYIIINQTNRKKGYAKKAIKKILKMKKFEKIKCFETTSIRKNNISSRKLFKSLDFKECTRNKQLYAKWCRN